MLSINRNYFLSMCVSCPFLYLCPFTWCPNHKSNCILWVLCNVYIFLSITGRKSGYSSVHLFCLFSCPCLCITCPNFFSNCTMMCPSTNYWLSDKIHVRPSICPSVCLMSFYIYFVAIYLFDYVIINSYHTDIMLWSLGFVKKIIIQIFSLFCSSFINPLWNCLINFPA